MGDVQQIVDKLNQAPFNLSLSLVSFSQKSSQELREVLNDVLVNIDSRQRRDLRDEPPDATAARHLEIVRVLKYRPSTDGATFRQGILDADPLTVYPLLLWLLNQLPLLQKRAYLAQFLVDDPLPEELFLDPEIQDAHALVKELQEQFKEAHKAVDQGRRTQRDPRALKAQVAAAEGEREQLGGRVGRVREKTKNVPGVEAFLEVASLLRKQQEEAALLAQSLKQQQDAFEAAGQKEARALAKLRDVRARAASNAGPGALLAALAEETSLARYTAQERLPKEMEARRERLLAVQTVLDEPVSSEQDLAAMQAELKSLTADVNTLTERRDAREASGQDAVLRQQQQMAAIVARKKEAAWQKLEALNGRRGEVLRELEQKQAAAASGSGRVLKGEEFKRYANSLRGKNATYKRMKKELDDRTAEYGVLMRTQQILQEQEGGLREVIDEAEKRGEKTRKTSQTSASIAASDDNSPEGLARSLARVNDAIKERKAALAPKVKDLRALRTSLQEMEEEHSHRKKKFEESTLGFDSQRSKLEAELEKERADLQKQEKRAKELAEEAATVETNIKRVAEDGPGFVDRYKKEYTAQEELAKTLQERQKKLKEQERSAQGQKAMANDLRTLLQAKLRLASGSATWAGVNGSSANAFKSVEVVDKGGANRLVIGAAD